MSWIKRNEFDEFDPVIGVALIVICAIFLGMSVFGCYVLTEIVFRKWDVGPFWGTLYVIFCLSIGRLTYHLGTRHSEGFVPAKIFFGFLGACAALLGPFGFIVLCVAWLADWLDSQD